MTSLYLLKEYELEGISYGSCFSQNVEQLRFISVRNFFKDTANELTGAHRAISCAASFTALLNETLLYMVEMKFKKNRG